MGLKFILVISIGLLSFKDVNTNNQAKVAVESQTLIGITKDTFEFKDGIISIFEDSKRNFWFGTKENGVCKYNGESYTYFTTKHGLPHNQVRNIKEDTNGNILIKTGNGICSFDGNNFIKILEPTTENTQNNWSLSKDDLWFHVNANGVLKYNSSKLYYLPFPFANKSTNDTHISFLTLEFYTDQKGKVWFGTFNKGLIEYDGENFRRHNPDNFGVGTIRAIFQDDSGKYWFGSNGGGLYTYDGETYTNLTEKFHLVNENPMFDKVETLSRIWAINQDANDKMWFGTADSGLWLLDGDTLTNYKMKDGLPSNFVDIIYKDSKGKLWFGTGENSNGKLFTFNGKTFDEFVGFEIDN